MIRKYYILLIVSVLLVSKIAFNQACAATHANDTPSPKNSNDIEFSGFIAASYNYLPQNNEFISGEPSHAPDLQPNGFIFHQLNITVAKQPDQGLGGLINVIIGRDALSTAAYGFNPTTGVDNLGIDILESYIQYVTGPFTLMVGKYITLTGIEYTDTSQNFNFSQSFVSQFLPGTVLGVRGIYTINPKWTLIAGINNGWDNIRDTHRQKTVELGVTYTPNTFFSLSLSGYTGEERIEALVSTGPIGRRSIIDLIAQFNISQQISFVVDYNYAIQSKAALPDDIIGKATWQGLAAYINYKMTDKWRIALRGENFHDINGFQTSIAQNLKGATLTLAYAPTKNIEWRAEARRDFSNVNSFLNVGSQTISNHQQSYALEVILKFG